MPVAALPVTQQMTEMSISREEKVTPKTETTEPGMIFKNNLGAVSSVGPGCPKTLATKGKKN